MNNISKHISFKEATTSYTAKKLRIENTPNALQLHHMSQVASKIFEPVREHFNVPIYVSSFFRSAKLNAKIKGSKYSQHLCTHGAAIDVDADVFGKITNIEIFKYILENLEFDQLILEDIGNREAGWVHFSYNRGRNRKQVLLMHIKGRSPKYEPYSEETLNNLLLNEKN